MYNMHCGKLYCVNGNYNLSQTQTDSGCKYLVTLGYIMKHIMTNHNQSCDRKAQAFLMILLLISHH